MPFSKSFWSTKLRNWASVPAASISAQGRVRELHRGGKVGQVVKGLARDLRIR